MHSIMRAYRQQLQEELMHVPMIKHRVTNTAHDKEADASTPKEIAGIIEQYAMPTSPRKKKLAPEKKWTSL